MRATCYMLPGTSIDCPRVARLTTNEREDFSNVDQWTVMWGGTRLATQDIETTITEFSSQRQPGRASAGGSRFYLRPEFRTRDTDSLFARLESTTACGGFAQPGIILPTLQPQRPNAHHGSCLQVGNESSRPWIQVSCSAPPGRQVSRRRDPLVWLRRVDRQGPPSPCWTIIKDCITDPERLNGHLLGSLHFNCV